MKPSQLLVISVERAIRIFWLIALFKNMLILISEGSLKSADKLEKALKNLNRSEVTANFVRLLRQKSIMVEMFNRHYLPKPYTLGDLESYQPGTFGYAYYRHMIDNGLKLDYYPVPPPTNDLQYYRMRLIQTHDMW